VNLARVLKLERPLAVLDLETTGLDPATARIWQIAITKHYPDKDPVRWVSLVDPTIEVPAEATKDHAAVNERIGLEKPHKFNEMAPVLVKTLVKVDWAGFNVTYDLKVLRAEMRRAHVEWDWEKNESHVVDALRLFQILFPRNLQAAYKEFVDPGGFEDAHDAGADVAATEKVLAAQVEGWDHVPRTIPELAAFCFPTPAGAVDKGGKFIWANGEVVVNFGGKHRGKPLRMVETGYLEWIIKNDFADDVKVICANALKGKYPTR